MDEKQTRSQLTKELAALRRRVAELEASEADPRRTEEALRESEEQYRRIVETAQEGIWLIDADARTTYVNQRMADMLGYTVQEMLGRSPLDFMDRAVQKEAMRYFVRSRKGINEQRDFRFRRKDGSDLWTLAVTNPIFDQNGQFMNALGMFTDTTKRRQTEQELIRIQRLRALAEMSAGISHNLNNILTGIMGPAELLQMDTDDPQILERLDAILKSAEQARDLVERLYLSVRGGEETPHPVGVNSTVQDAVRAASPRWKDESEAGGISIEVVTNLKDVPLINGTQSGLHDILINLIFNAIDAMPEGGTISIDTEDMKGNVQLTVRDTGVGMDEETRRRVFEPFFTTKMNVGTGLGLSTVYGTVTRWGGNIDVVSAPGKGAAFTLQLPVWKGPEVEGEEGVEIRRIVRRKILVVEDDSGTCDLLSNLLSRNHTVEIVRSGPEALAQFLPGRYDVALIDLGMPKMPGDRVAQKMRQIDPLVATVLITGWRLPKGDPRLSAFDFLLQKPLSPLDKVQNVVVQAIDLHDARAEETG